MHKVQGVILSFFPRHRFALVRKRPVDAPVLRLVATAILALLLPPCHMLLCHAAPLNDDFHASAQATVEMIHAEPHELFYPEHQCEPVR